MLKKISSLIFSRIIEDIRLFLFRIKGFKMGKGVKIGRNVKIDAEKVVLGDRVELGNNILIKGLKELIHAALEAAKAAVG